MKPENIHPQEAGLKPARKDPRARSGRAQVRSYKADVRKDPVRVKFTSAQRTSARRLASIFHVAYEGREGT